MMRLLLLLSSLAAAAAAQPKLIETRLAEPVFGGELFVREGGDGTKPPVLFVHGLGQDAGAVWESVLDTFAADRRVLAPDLPGFGRSGRPPGRYSPARYAELLDWLADRLPPGRFDLVGHSMGGAVALHFAARHPERLRRLVLIDAAGLLDRHCYGLQALQLPTSRQLPPLLRGLGEQLNDWIADGLAAFDRRHPDPLDWLRRAEPAWALLLSDQPNANAALALMQHDFGSDLARVRTPTVILWGAQDRVTPPRIAHLLHARLPLSRLEFLPEADHTPMRSQPAALEAALVAAVDGPFSPTDPWPAPGRSEHDVHCHGEEIFLTGQHRDIELDGCQARIENLDARRLVLRNGARAELFRVRLRNPDGPALAVHDGRLEGTAVDLAGEPALLADGARLDLAGAELTALEAAVQVEDRSFLVWSVSRITSRRHCRRLHGAVHLKAATLPAETLDPAYARDCGLQLVFTPRSNSAPAAARTAAAPKAAAPPPAAHSQPAP